MNAESKLFIKEWEAMHVHSELFPWGIAWVQQTFSRPKHGAEGSSEHQEPDISKSS